LLDEKNAEQDIIIPMLPYETALKQLENWISEYKKEEGHQLLI
jgi:hypothetical protein